MVDVIAYCNSKTGAVEEHPFKSGTVVFKVNDKAFALLPNEGKDGRVTLKCDPKRAISLRKSHPEITPGYHMNKEHWNTLDLNGKLPAQLVHELVDHSYELVRSE